MSRIHNSVHMYHFCIFYWYESHSLATIAIYKALRRILLWVKFPRYASLFSEIYRMARLQKSRLFSLPEAGLDETHMIRFVILSSLFLTKSIEIHLLAKRVI